MDDYTALPDDVVAKSPRSKLQTYEEMIRRLRAHNFTYKDISKLLLGRFGVSVAPSTIHNFVKVRDERHKRGKRPFELPPTGRAPVEI